MLYSPNLALLQQLIISLDCLCLPFPTFMVLHYKLQWKCRASNILWEIQFQKPLYQYLFSRIDLAVCMLGWSTLTEP